MNIKNIINEEVDKEVDRVVKKLKLSGPEAINNIINELFNMTTDKLMHSLGAVEYDNKNSIANENWDSFVQILSKSIAENNDIWKQNLKEIKVKILCFKYFTRQDLISQEQLESHIKIEIKPYFTALENYKDLNDFRSKVLLLPSQLLYNIIRYLFYLNDDLKNSIKVTNNELKDIIVELQSKRMEVANTISKISKGYSVLLDLSNIKDLFDCGIFFEDNFINRGINEFIFKLLNHEEANEILRDKFPGAMLKDIMNIAETSSSYVAHISAIRDESGYEYFTKNGEQLGNRFDNDILSVKEGTLDGYVIDNKSRFKEPTERINNFKPGSADNPTSGGSSSDGGVSGGSGGGSFGGGGFQSGLGNADFAEPGTEGEVPGAEDAGGGSGGEIPNDNEPTMDPESDGEPIPDADGDSLPDDFGTVEDNTVENKPVKDTSVNDKK